MGGISESHAKLPPPGRLFGGGGISEKSRYVRSNVGNFTVGHCIIVTVEIPSHGTPVSRSYVIVQTVIKLLSIFSAMQ